MSCLITRYNKKLCFQVTSLLMVLWVAIVVMFTGIYLSKISLFFWQINQVIIILMIF